MDDRQLSRLLQRLETDGLAESSIAGGSLDRAYPGIERERQTHARRGRSPLAWWSLGLNRSLASRPVALLMVASLLVGMVLGGAFVAGTLVRQPPAPRTLQVAPGARLTLPGRPYAIAWGSGSLWIASGDTIQRVQPDAQGPHVSANLVAGSGPVAVGSGPAGIWAAASADDVVRRIDPATNSFATTVPIDAPEFVAVDDRDVWVASTTTGLVHRIDAATGTITASILVGNAPVQPTIAFGSVWIPHDCIIGSPDVSLAAVTRVSPTTNRVAGAAAGDGFGCIRSVAAADTSLWFTDANDGTVSELDPVSSAVERTLEVGERAAGVVAWGDSIWVTCNPSGSAARIVRIDRQTGRLVETLELPIGPELSTSGLTQLVVLDGGLWILADISGRPELLRVDPPA